MKSESPSEHYETSSVERKGQVVHLFKQVSKRGLERLEDRKEWQQRVYKNVPDDSQSLIEFHSLCNFVFKRDGMSCQSCFKTRYKLSFEQLYLTAHHIISREEGGTNDMDNLITLCNKCHDLIEESSLKTREEIYGFCSGDKRHWSRDENIGLSWQQWVYGGRRKPRHM